ncbi:MAG: lipid-A-disaccharide synthase [Cyanophyceae cyanobacterium]
MVNNVPPVDILILSNGPGEVTTWVRPVVQALREQLGQDRSQTRISVIFSPCPHATGKEAAIARHYREVDRVLESRHFFRFLLTGQIDLPGWDWRPQGGVVFLGGDQFYTLVIGHRLGYATVVYAEWEARWVRWIDQFCVTVPQVIAKVPPRYRQKMVVVGDLMANAESTGRFEQPSSPPAERIGLLPGSKAAKLAQGVPLSLAIAEQIQARRPQAQFFIPVAPTIDLPTLARFADPQHNPVVSRIGSSKATLVVPTEPDQPAYFQLANGVSIQLATQFPATRLLMQCCLCITTVGANTAELGALGIPMLVLLPTYQLDAMRSWDGLPGMLASLPGLGSAWAKLINRMVLKQGRLFAWPNIWANSEIVPELVGELRPQDIARQVLELLENPHQLQAMRDRLLATRGQPGAARRIARAVSDQLPQAALSQNTTTTR